MPNTSALRVGTLCLGSGRERVRFITASMSASATQFSALAEPAAMVPPNNVANTSHGDGMPRAASIIAGTVVTSSSSMMRGLVSATYARSTSVRRRGPATERPASAAALTGGMWLPMVSSATSES